MSTAAVILETLGSSVRPSLSNAPLRTSKALSTASLRRLALPTSRRPLSAPRIQRAHQSSAAVAEEVYKPSRTSSAQLKKSLHRVASEGNVGMAHHIISELLAVRREEPDLDMYAAAILVNTDAQLGSAGAVGALVKEMADSGLEPTSEICHNVLKALAVHPDYLLREAILEYMRQRWISITEDGRHDIAIGLLRDRQFEFALEQIEAMEADGVAIQPWLYDMAIHMLCDAEEPDEAFRIVRERAATEKTSVSKLVYYRLLDVASDMQNHEVTSFIWNRQVSSGYIIPSAGMCDNVLATAARHGDARLASDVFRLVGERRQVLTQYQYEMLVDTYVQARDIEKAASVLCIMQENKFAVNEYSTRRLFRWARGAIARPKDLFKVLRKLAKEGRKVPIALVHVAMEASLYQKDIEYAIEQYKALNSVCPGGPSTETFNMLLRSLHGRKDLAMYLMSEMVERGIRPDHLTYDRLLLICLVEEDYEDAFLHYREMRKRGYSPRSGTFGAMAKRCAAADDERAWLVPDMMRGCGIEESSTSLLRQLVASPRVHHTASNLDLCYVAPNIIATSGPSGTYPTRAYRNPLHTLVKYLDKEHGDQWAIWEFRAEGTGYGDDEVHGRVWHFPWPDHHPPPFSVVPRVMASMSAWLRREDGSGEDKDKKQKERVVVVHCKAGKGRSGTMSCAYLISEEGWSMEDALNRFTERRMRPGFGAGVSIPSQLRWVGYVDRWTKGGKIYVERQVEVLEVHVWGLRDGVKVGVEGYVDEGRRIKSFHTFSKAERQVVRGKVKDSAKLADVVVEVMGKGNGSSSKRAPSKERKANLEQSSATNSDSEAGEQQKRDGTDTPTDLGADVVFRPSSRVILPTNDVNIDFERRNKAMYGYTMVTSVAHVWFNTFFEGRGPEKEGQPDDSGVFELEWDKMDGIKGSLRKGTRAFDRFSVVWRTLPKEETGKDPVVMTPHKAGEPIAQVEPPASQQVTDAANAADSRDLGLRTQTPPASMSDLSRASSVRKTDEQQQPRMVVSADASGADATGTKMSGPDGKEMAPPTVSDSSGSGSSSEDLGKKSEA
ncbi:pentatricopeptide repeat protein [Phyllosticta capitalensis]